MSKTDTGFNRNGRRFERRVTTRSLLSQFDNSSQKNGLEAFNKAIEFEKKHYYLNTSHKIWNYPALKSKKSKQSFIFNSFSKFKS